MERGQLVDRLGLDWFRIDDGMTDVAQGVIHRLRQGMDNGRLLIAGQHYTGSPVLLEIMGYGTQPLGRGRQMEGGRRMRGFEYAECLG